MVGSPSALAAEDIVVLSLPLWAWQGLVSITVVAVLVWLARPALRGRAPSSLRWWALGNIVANAVITLSGATVRVTGSGLGCSEWPRCTPDSFVPVNTEHSALQAAIEFGNRTLALPVLAVGVIVLLATLRTRPRRGDLTAMAATIVVGVAGQAAVGGVTVWSGLHPITVTAHFLLSMLVLAVAVALYVRCREPRGTLRPTVTPAVGTLTLALLATGFLVLVAGTVVTGNGPHGGDPGAPRWGVDMVLISRTHSLLAWLAVLLTLALMVPLVRGRGPRQVRVQVWLVLAALLGQGAIGYTQYFLGVPEGLVVAHVLGAILTWVAVVRLYLATTERVAVSRSPVPAAEETAVPARTRDR
ncbi:COX15/CtaA family protein [Halostreptopolyspora alba]|uniref:Heme A synthase n=1 Tax=Halostreptopolyspora alba TaxID=2487137 RepID=A0A3N0EBR6_9ACTN|nr:heme A synthase [Nocardiopsaceae bacterium YIM 96095]